jgi:PAS domain S-box-containing protein
MRELKDIITITRDMRLLYVEDNDLVRGSTSPILENIFADVVIAVDGEDGIEKFYEYTIDIVITDINMPRLNGLDMVESIRKFDKNIPILLLSAHNETEYFTRSINLSVDGYLLKPLKMKDLVFALDKIVDQMLFLQNYNNNIVFLQQYQELTDVNTAVSKTDLEGNITYVNEQFSKLTGFSEDELLGITHSIMRHPDTSASLYADLWHKIKHEKLVWKGILKNISKSGDIFYTDTVVKPILDRDGDIVEYISLKSDITDVFNPKKQLYDIMKLVSNPMLINIEIDGFKNINSFYGHELSQRIQDNFFEYLKRYIPSELGFSKFLALGDGKYIFIKDLKNSTQKDIENIIEELKDFQFIIHELKLDVGDIDYDISILLSVAVGENCIENAEYGMNEIQKNKKEFIFAKNFLEKEQHKARNNIEKLRMIKVAIENNKIISHFQPIVSNKTKQIIKYESLVRLIDEEDNVISPYFFLNVAKQGKYYSRVTNIVLENSFKALTQTDKSISINISALDIEDITTRNRIYKLLETHKDEATRVVFELLEDENIRDLDKIVEFINIVKSYGVKIAIDDFGAGYSNFIRLSKYQPDILKIDGSLIKDIETDSYSLSVVKTIVTFAKEQKLEVVAEYIENENIYNILKDLGVEYSQGYFFGKAEMLSKYESIDE